MASMLSGTTGDVTVTTSGQDVLVDWFPRSWSASMASDTFEAIPFDPTNNHPTVGKGVSRWTGTVEGFLGYDASSSGIMHAELEDLIQEQLTYATLVLTCSTGRTVTFTDAHVTGLDINVETQTFGTFTLTFASRAHPAFA